MWMASAGVARHHAAVAGTSQMPSGTSLQVTGGGAADVGHACVKMAVEHRTGTDGVPVLAGPLVPLSCLPVGAADRPWRLLRVGAERDWSRCVVLRC
jgi:hypothetical protein